MKNNRTSGLDGFTSEFQKYFWNDVYIYLVRSLNTAGKVGRLSISRILKTLDFFGFGKDLCNWVKTFYTDQISCILRNDPIISGIKFNDSEYLANQYADDTSLTLEDDPVSLERCLQIFDKFGDCAGLRANLDKIQAVWFGSGHGCGIEYLPHRNLLWNHSGKFKVLGIEFDLGCPNKVINNFHTKLKKLNRY